MASEVLPYTKEITAWIMKAGQDGSTTEIDRGKALLAALGVVGGVVVLVDAVRYYNCLRNGRSTDSLTFYSWEALTKVALAWKRKDKDLKQAVDSIGAAEDELYNMLNVAADVVLKHKAH